MTEKSPHPLYSRDCQACGCPLAFVEDGYGKVQVLDLRSPVFHVDYGPHGRRAISTGMAFVSHFATCPLANDFKKSKKEVSNESI